MLVLDDFKALPIVFDVGRPAEHDHIDPACRYNFMVCPCSLSVKKASKKPERKKNVSTPALV